MQEQQVLMLATFFKVMNNEPLTMEEVDRWLQIITVPFSVSSPKQEEVEKKKFALRQALKQVYEIK